MFSVLGTELPHDIKLMVFSSLSISSLLSITRRERDDESGALALLSGAQRSVSLCHEKTAESPLRTIRSLKIKERIPWFSGNRESKRTCVVRDTHPPRTAVSARQGLLEPTTLQYIILGNILVKEY